MAKAIGIDLGTTNSVVAIKKIETQIILNNEGEELTPSVVSLQKKNQFLVGKDALNWMQQDPQNTISSIKRLMGRSFSDSEIKSFIEDKRFSYTIKPLSQGSEQSIAVILGKTEYRPEQISTKIIEKIKQDAEKSLQEPVEYAVVTVPAYFNDKQKNATRIAAALAGIKVLRLLPEPTAAAISFGVDNIQEDEAKTILVYDLGGGTFDISVLTIAGGQFIEQGKGGDMWMGGDDIDDLIRQYVYSETEQENDIEDLSVLIEKLPVKDKNRLIGDLKKKIEQAKITLSSRNKAYIDILGVLKDEDGDILDIDVELSRAKFEALLMPFVERTKILTEKLLSDIDFDLELIDQVIMVGGSSNIPLVVKTVKDFFGEEKVMVHPRTMLAIAEGAAILAHRLADTYECPRCGHSVNQTEKICSKCDFDLEQNLIKTGILDIVHTSSHDYFIELADKSDYLLVEKNTPLPFKTQSSFKLIHKDQHLARLKFFNKVNHNHESIGELWLSFDLSFYDEGDTLPEIQLNFEIDINNIITLSASLEDHPETKISKTLSRGGEDEQLFIELETAIDKVNSEKKDYYTKMEFLERSEKLAEQINQVIDANTGAVNQKIIQKVIQQQQIALTLFAEDEHFLSNVYYIEAFISQYGSHIEPKDLDQLKKSLAKFKIEVEQGSLKKMTVMRNKLLSHLEQYSLLQALMRIDTASEAIAESRQNEAIHLQEMKARIMKALEHGNEEQAMQLFDEIMPKLHSITENECKQDLHIWKEIKA